MRLVRYFPTSSWISIRIISNNCPGFSWIALNNSATSVTLTVSSIGCSSFFNVLSANTLYRRCVLLYTLKQFHTIQFTLSLFKSITYDHVFIKDYFLQIFRKSQAIFPAIRKYYNIITRNQQQLIFEQRHKHKDK